MPALSHLVAKATKVSHASSGGRWSPLPMSVRTLASHVSAAAAAGLGGKCLRSDVSVVLVPASRGKLARVAESARAPRWAFF